MSFERNTVKSFRKVKADMENLQSQIFQLKEKIEYIESKSAGNSKKKKR